MMFFCIEYDLLYVFLPFPYCVDCTVVSLYTWVGRGWVAQYTEREGSLTEAGLVVQSVYSSV